MLAVFNVTDACRRSRPRRGSAFRIAASPTTTLPFVTELHASTRREEVAHDRVAGGLQAQFLTQQAAAAA